MSRPNLAHMTPEQRIKYLEGTDHLVVKWVNRLNGTDSLYRCNNKPYITNKLSEATLYDMKFFAAKIPGHTLVSVTKIDLFEAILKGI